MYTCKITSMRVTLPLRLSLNFLTYGGMVGIQITKSKLDTEQILEIREQSIT